MQRMLIVLALLAAPVAQAALIHKSVAVSNLVEPEDLAEDMKHRPVSKVVAILKDMLKTMEKEQEEDEEIYNKLMCWCETNDREKTKSIAEAEAKIEALTTQIEELTQLSAQLSTEIKNTEKEVSANQAALDKATAIRQKELAEFNAAEKDMLQSIAALKGALAVLAKHHSLLQMPKGAWESVTATMKREMEKHALLLEGVLTGDQRKTATAFIQQAYAPQSGEVYGILEQMKETFDADLSETQKEEAANVKAYEELKAAKESEIAAGKEQIDMKTQELAKTDESNANAKQDLEDTKNSLSADEQFLMNLKEHCSMTDKEWDERVKTRQLEMEACSKALAILNSDDSEQLFTKTFNAAFMQTRAATKSTSREQASKVVAEVAKKNRSPQLAALAIKIRLDAFTRVKKAIDDMIAMLLAEQEDEQKQKDFCVDEFHTNEVQTTNKDREKEDLIQLIDELTQTIKELTEAIETLKAEIAELQKQIKYAGEDREKANQEFQVTIADQRETQKVLAVALKFLSDWYGKTAQMEAEKTVFLQAHKQEPPAAFKKYESSKSNTGVMDMIQDIINEAKAMEAETIRAEEDSQKAYEDFVKESNACIEAKTEEMVNKMEEKAQTEAAKVQAEKDKANVLLELEQLANYNAQLHSSCDFVLKNFDLRQQARSEEVEALRQAKQILSGAKFQEFLQH